MELINNMGFIKVEELDSDSKEEIKNNISAGAKELKKITNSKPKKQATLKEFLNELLCYPYRKLQKRSKKIMYIRF